MMFCGEGSIILCAPELCFPSNLTLQRYDATTALVKCFGDFFGGVISVIRKSVNQNENPCLCECNEIS